ncbi:hypothetical protein [Nocardiopsis suaedae]|uniref:DUF304 domain-containing protein n=1 Tax=Nocardiopsis suaedae TaxID=3018444 RepID=A0ABT4THC8_9ACTN|nr:hypothetical protein [Nocardiopsis suaedae]MDA2803766.1 hypothetical protein [Nocardiopsis suaedae]
MSGAQNKSFREDMKAAAAATPQWDHFHKRAKINMIAMGAIGVGATFLTGTMFSDGYEHWSSYIWTAVAAVPVAFILGFLGYRVSAVVVLLDKPKRVFRISNGFNNTVNVPINAIAYMGKADFTRKDLFRLTRLRLLNETGPGIEIIGRDGKYITVRTDKADEVIQAALDCGMNPNAVKIPFPENAVNEKWRDTEREQRPAPGRPAA